MNWRWRRNQQDANPERVACRDEHGRRTEIGVHASGDGRVTLRLPSGECFELDPLEGVGGLRAALRAKVLESSSPEGIAKQN